MFKKLIATTASVVALSATFFPLSPAHALGGASRALVVNGACMALFLDGSPFRILRRGFYPYMESGRRSSGQPVVMLRVHPRPYRRANVTIPINCVQHFRGRVVEH